MSDEFKNKDNKDESNVTIDDLMQKTDELLQTAGAVAGLFGKFVRNKSKELKATLESEEFQAKATESIKSFTEEATNVVGKWADKAADIVDETFKAAEDIFKTAAEAGSQDQPEQAGESEAKAAPEPEAEPAPVPTPEPEPQPETAPAPEPASAPEPEPYVPYEEEDPEDITFVDVEHIDEASIAQGPDEKDIIIERLREEIQREKFEGWAEPVSRNIMNTPIKDARKLNLNSGDPRDSIIRRLIHELEAARDENEYRRFLDEKKNW